MFNNTYVAALSISYGFYLVSLILCFTDFAITGSDFRSFRFWYTFLVTSEIFVVCVFASSIILVLILRQIIAVQKVRQEYLMSSIYSDSNTNSSSSVLMAQIVSKSNSNTALEVDEDF